jgi:hypothetical protein
MVQDAVDVIEDVPLPDRRVLVVFAEKLERPVGDALATIDAVLAAWR